MPGLIAELSGVPGAHPFRNTDRGLAEMAADVTMRVMNHVRENYCLGSAGKRRVGIADPSRLLLFQFIYQARDILEFMV